MEQNLRRTEKKERMERKKRGKPKFSLKPWPTLFFNGRFIVCLLRFVLSSLKVKINGHGNLEKFNYASVIQYILHFYLLNSKQQKYPL